ncbi:MAG: DinB family protein [Nitrospinae bacterium]|nr:DinB family protein [Nitrospinota bacterium]
MNNDINDILSALKKTPRILRNLVANVDAELLNEHRVPGKWCAHEHAVHFAKVETLVIGRIRKFLTEKTPEFKSYVPGTTTPPDELMKLDLKESLKKFTRDRKTLLGLIKQLRPKDWRKNATHQNFKSFTPYIAIRHLLMHDYVHLYRIEELLLVKNIPKK